jgi:hypothetical protein
VISVKRLTGKQLSGTGGELKQLRAELGNDIAIKAYREGKLPFPDGSIIAALHWNEDSSDADNKVLAEGFPGLGLEATFAAPVNVQFMVKDSKNTLRRAAGDSPTSRTANLATWRCTKSAGPATSPIAFTARRTLSISCSNENSGTCRAVARLSEANSHAAGEPTAAAKLRPPGFG